MGQDEVLGRHRLLILCVDPLFHAWVRTGADQLRRDISIE